MKKLLALILALLMIVGAFVSCGKKKQPDATNDSESSSSINRVENTDVIDDSVETNDVGNIETTEPTPTPEPTPEQPDSTPDPEPEPNPNPMPEPMPEPDDTPDSEPEAPEFEQPEPEPCEHDNMQWLTTETHHKKFCDDCQSSVGDAEQHSWNDGACIVCDYVCLHSDKNTDHECDICGSESSKHNMENGSCAICGAIVYVRSGDTVYFGSYPQSEVTDITLKSKLSSTVEGVPTSEKANGWTSYGYYKDREISNYMWYIDVEEGGERYRGVYFTSYRSYYTGDSGETDLDSTTQDNNGYYVNTVYWFKYEPIVWSVIKVDTDAKTPYYVLICNMIIDSQEYYPNNVEERYVDGDTVYANNYEYSTVRRWLNEVFYETAFNDLEQSAILTSVLTNSADTTADPSNAYACDDTKEKIYPLAYTSVTAEVYGLTTDESRMRKPTDYSKAQGAYTNENGYGYWWLRSPYDAADRAHVVFYDGVRGYATVDSTYIGVVPTLIIKM